LRSNAIMSFTPEARHAAVLQVIVGVFGDSPSHLMGVEQSELVWKPADEPLRSHLQKHIQGALSGSRQSIHVLHGWCVQAAIAKLLAPDILAQADWDAVMTMARSAQHTVVVPSIQLLADQADWCSAKQNDSFWASRISCIQATNDEVRMEVDGATLMRGIYSMGQPSSGPQGSSASAQPGKFSLFRFLGLVREPH